MESECVSKIFEIDSVEDFNQMALETFRFQYQENSVYAAWCNLLGVDVHHIHHYLSIPFLPISFFKTHTIQTTQFQPEKIFESSGTTGSINSKHWVKEMHLYEQSFTKCFEAMYGAIKDWCIIGLLPSYLERNNSSLVTMVDAMIQESTVKESGFYLNNHAALYQTLLTLEHRQQKTLLIGVTFGLLDFVEQYNMTLHHTIVMETGGMKGRREEWTRQAVHQLLQRQLDVKTIHSEYGMTELLSQAYAKSNGRFVCPNWMKVVVRDEEDPLHVQTTGRGVLNIIDLANQYSVAFIATEDLGIVYEDGSFEVLGRLDQSDVRGCSLMVV